MGSRSEKTKNGNKSVKKEMLIDGEKGLSVSFLYKDGDDEKNFYKVFFRSEDDKMFSVTEKKGEKETTKEMTKAEFEKMVKGDKNLEFAHLYMTKGASALKGKKSKKKSSKKSKKKSSKKSKKKSSKKSSKKSKKKSSEKSSKSSKKSMKGGKAKKASKKAKKASKKSKKSSKKSKKKSKKTSK